jgi:hypothetical protein
MFFCEPRYPYFQAVKKIHKCKFTPEEDEKLKQLVAIHGENEWATIAHEMGNRNSRQCRERWRNYMNPRLSNESWTPESDKILMERYAAIGPHWNMIAQAFPNRSVKKTATITAAQKPAASRVRDLSNIKKPAVIPAM